MQSVSRSPQIRRTTAKEYRHQERKLFDRQLTDWEVPVEGYEALPQFPKRSALPFRRTIRRHELRQIVPLAETTIYEMEHRGEFPRRFNLTPRCAVWDLAEVEAWVKECKQAPRAGVSKPDAHQRKTRPVRAGSNKA